MLSLDCYRGNLVSCFLGLNWVCMCVQWLVGFLQNVFSQLERASFVGHGLFSSGLLSIPKPWSLFCIFLLRGGSSLGGDPSKTTPGSLSQVACIAAPENCGTASHSQCLSLSSPGVRSDNWKLSLCRFLRGKLDTSMLCCSSSRVHMPSSPKITSTGKGPPSFSHMGKEKLEGICHSTPSFSPKTFLHVQPQTFYILM